MWYACSIVIRVRFLSFVGSLAWSVWLKPCTSDWDLNPRAGSRTWPKPWLGLEPTWLGLEPGQNSDWDSNPQGWDSNPASTHGLPTEITSLVSGLNEAQVLDVSSQKESVRDRVMGKKWIYLERNTLHRQSVGHLRKWERHRGIGLSAFIGVGNFIGQWVGGVFQLFWKGVGISRNWATAHFLILMVCLGTVMPPVGVSFSLLMCYSERILRLLKVYWKSTCPLSWTHLVLISLCHVLGLCHSFKGCALPPSFLFHV